MNAFAIFFVSCTINYFGIILSVVIAVSTSPALDYEYNPLASSHNLYYGRLALMDKLGSIFTCCGHRKRKNGKSATDMVQGIFLHKKGSILSEGPSELRLHGAKYGQRTCLVALSRPFYAENGFVYDASSPYRTNVPLNGMIITENGGEHEVAVTVCPFRKRNNNVPNSDDEEQHIHPSWETGHFYVMANGIRSAFILKDVAGALNYQVLKGARRNAVEEDDGAECSRSQAGSLERVGISEKSSGSFKRSDSVKMESHRGNGGKSFKNSVQVGNENYLRLVLTGFFVWK